MTDALISLVALFLLLLMAMLFVGAGREIARTRRMRRIEREREDQQRR